MSFALGAFFAGLVLSESEFSQQAASETLPLRDAFAVLFFVSVGMLFDPGILVREPGAVLSVLLIIIVGKSAAALAITTVFKLDRRTSLTVAASLAVSAGRRARARPTTRNRPTKATAPAAPPSSSRR